MTVGAVVDRAAALRAVDREGRLEQRIAANRTVELRGAITSSSNGFFEVDLDGSSEGNIDGVARIDYRNNSALERIDVYGNAGNDRFRFDFRR